MLNKYALTLGVVFVVAGCRTVEPPAPPDAPRISSFVASKTRVASGETVTLSFATTGAAKVELTDDQGRDVQLEGTEAEGSATVAPTRTSFYVLRATGVGGRDTAFVQIAVNEPLRDLFLLAVPAEIESGAQSQLLWGAPGALSVTLSTNGGMPQMLTGTTGAVTVSPQTTTQYLLRAEGAPGTAPLTAVATVEVLPVLTNTSFEAPNGFKAGEPIRFAWQTGGASKVLVTERTFGVLTEVTAGPDVASGTFEYTLPATLPNGVAVAEGLPLQFVISAVSGETRVTKSFDAVVGEAPAILQFVAPEFVSVGQTFTLNWRTANATQVSVSAGGLPVFTSLPGATARVSVGSLTLPAPVAATQYVFAASNDRGIAERRTFTVRPVALPVIDTYTLTQSLNAFGDAATARWTTTNAVLVVVRLENGATLGTEDRPSRVASGTFAFTPASSARVSVEAFNAAGDRVTQTRSVTLPGGPVFLTPNPAVRGTDTSLEWTLAPVVTETVGLPFPLAAPITSSTNFIDLATVATAKELQFFDSTAGLEQLPPFPGFNFPLVGTARSEFFVSVDGYVLFARPATALSGNADLSASGNTTPSIIAPFWDDLTLTPTSKVLYELRTNPLQERFLVIQWDRLQSGSNATSELTFQVHLYETGQVAFLYKTVTGAVNSATIGVKDTAYPVVRLFSYNTATANLQASPGLELNFFSGGPATGSLTVPATSNRRINFFGRTAAGVVPASASLQTFAAGELTITEAMPLPAPTAASGQWIEIRNNADASVDLGGLLVTTPGSPADGGFVIFPDTVIGPNGYLVIGESTDSTANGGAGVQQATTDLPLAVPGSARVSIGNTTIASLTWDAGVVGSSISVATDVFAATGAAPVCTRTTRTVTFGPAGAFGTPGAPNEACTFYTVTQIDGGFITPPTGSAILPSLGADSAYATVTLPAAFTYFGTAYTQFDFSTNGFITFGAPLADSHTLNATAPGTAQPNGVIAPFWDDLDREDQGKQSMWRLTDRTVISWDEYEIWLQTAGVMNFQVHLLDNGVIEFHYGDLSTTSTTQTHIDRLFGNSATIWLEPPSGEFAIPWRINQLNAVAPNSGLRFTPVP